MLKTMKKYIPKRKYRERSQLERRKNLGLLEKKQDYKKRAEDYHRKEANYKKLKEKARTRNPDEFYFKMTNAKTIDGEHYQLKGGKTLEKRLDHQQKLLNLVNYRKSINSKEKEKLKVNLELFDTGNAKPSNHTIFVDDEDEVLKFNAEDYFETDGNLVDNTSNRLKKSQLNNIQLPSDENLIKKINQQKKNEFKKLGDKFKEEKVLYDIAAGIEKQKELMKPAKRKKVEDNVYSYFQERKK